MSPRVALARAARRAPAMGARAIATDSQLPEITLALIKPTVCIYEPNIRHAFRQIREKTDLQVSCPPNERSCVPNPFLGRKKKQLSFTLNT